MEAIAKFMPCNGKGEIIEEVYVDFELEEIEKIMDEGITRNNQDIKFELQSTNRLDTCKKYDIIFEYVDGKDELEAFSIYISRVYIEKIKNNIVYAAVTGKVEIKSE